MSDLISRQWLMECVNEGWIKFDTEKDANTYIHLVRDIAPSAQPEIIRCKDCENWAMQVKDVKGDGLGSCEFHKVNFVTGEGYCYWAERRTDG